MEYFAFKIATVNPNVNKVRYLPYVFTEHGILMLSNVLNSSKAINISIEIIRVFNKLKQISLSQSVIGERLNNL